MLQEPDLGHIHYIQNVFPAAHKSISLEPRNYAILLHVYTYCSNEWPNDINEISITSRPYFHRKHYYNWNMVVLGGVLEL